MYALKLSKDSSQVAHDGALEDLKLLPGVQPLALVSARPVGDPGSLLRLSEPFSLE